LHGARWVLGRMGKSLYTEKAKETSYWNEALEKMPRQELDALHLRRLRALISHAYRNIPMYREIYDRAGVKPEDIRTLDDYVEKLPALDKTDVLAYQAKGQSTVTGSEQYRSFFFQTSGTTGRVLQEPAYFPDMLNNECYKLWGSGLGPRDSFYFAFPFGTFCGFWAMYIDGLFLGAQVISGGGVDSETRIRHILEFRPTALVATPTYALRLAEVAKERGIDSRTTSVRFILTGGEQIAPSVRKVIEQAWDAKILDTYGISDMMGSVSWQCPLHPDRMHLAESQVYGIVVDEQGKVVPSGGKGEFVLTNFEVTVQPLIKYRSHDVVEWHEEACRCGRTWRWIKGGVLGRTDQMVTVKGTNVYPTAIQALLGEIPDLSERVEVHIDREGNFDKVSVKVEANAATEAKSYAGLQAQAEELLRRKIGVRIPVECVPPMSLPRYEMKAKVVFDHRPKAVAR
jgi:phenylacetate-CoA ligase